MLTAQDLIELLQAVPPDTIIVKPGYHHVAAWRADAVIAADGQIDESQDEEQRKQIVVIS